MHMVTKLVRVKIYHKVLPYIKSHDPLIMWCCKVLGQFKYISLVAKDMDTKLSKIITYCKQLSP